MPFTGAVREITQVSGRGVSIAPATPQPLRHWGVWLGGSDPRYHIEA